MSQLYNWMNSFGKFVARHAAPRRGSALCEVTKTPEASDRLEETTVWVYFCPLAGTVNLSQCFPTWKESPQRQRPQGRRKFPVKEGPINTKIHGIFYVIK